jgi:very-short-patch-repair endonuclease
MGIDIYINFFDLKTMNPKTMNSSRKSNYNKTLKPYARILRNDSTKGEIILWKEVLGNRQMLGLQFLRQFPIDNYIADFVC